MFVVIHEMGSAWWQCAACLRTQEEDICELHLNNCNLYDVPPDVFIYERTLEKLYLDANRVKINIIKYNIINYNKINIYIYIFFFYLFL